MNDAVARDFTQRAIHHLQEDFLPKIRECLQHLSKEQIWWRPNESSNSIGNLILHLCGNVRQWIVSGVGGQPDRRDRPAEFQERRLLPADVLLLELTDTVKQACQVIASMGGVELGKRHRLQVYDVTGLQAVFHVIEHFSYHTGQIIYITKMLIDQDLQFYDDTALSEKARDNS